MFFHGFYYTVDFPSWYDAQIIGFLLKSLCITAYPSILCFTWFGSPVNMFFTPFLIKYLVLTVQGLKTCLGLLWPQLLLPCFSNCLVAKCLLPNLFELNIWTYCVWYKPDKHMPMCSKQQPLCHLGLGDVIVQFSK